MAPPSTPSNLFIHPSTSSVPRPPHPHPPTFLLSHKTGQCAFTRSRQGAWRRDKTIISLAAAAHAGAPAADRILTQAAVLAQIAAQSALRLPRHFLTRPTVVAVFGLFLFFFLFFTPGHKHPKLIFWACVCEHV